MFLFLLGSYCVLLVLKNNAFAEKETTLKTTKRFIVEDSYKPPIFGSRSYNPITEEFEISIKVNNHTNGIDNHYDYSTKTGGSVVARKQPSRGGYMFTQKHVTRSLDKITPWWVGRGRRNLSS